MLRVIVLIKVAQASRICATDHVQIRPNAPDLSVSLGKRTTLYSPPHLSHSTRHKRVTLVSTRSIWKCKGCKKQFSAKAGTIMEDSPIGLDKWLPAIWMLCGCKNGISSYEIGRDLGVTQKTAWFLLHRIRLALESGSIEKKLSGDVEADETFVGGKIRNMNLKAKGRHILKHGRLGSGVAGKAIVPLYQQMVVE